RRIHVAELTDDESSKAGNVRRGHRSAIRKKIQIGSSIFAARADHEINHETRRPNDADVADLRLRRKDPIATRRGNANYRLPEIAVRGQPVKHCGRIEAKRAKTDRSGGG